MSPAPPTAEELTAYLSGALPQERFAAVDRWLEQLPEDEATRVLTAAEATLPRLHLDCPSDPPTESFCSELPRSRLQREDLIGEGGMAVVLRATDRSLKRVVALKVLKPRLPTETLEDYYQREQAFRREAALTAALVHPAIPPVYDIGRAEGRPAFTMQRLAGRTLADAVEGQRFPALGLIAPFLRVVEAIAFAHSNSIVHRDLTPRNILIGDFGAVYVLDWGIAVHPGEGAGTCMGTPGWMAPEQFMAEPASPRMDVFALGGLLYLLLTGHSHRPNLTTPGVLELSRLDARGVPRGLAAVARRCLSIAPASRYASAAEVGEELRRWLDEGLTLAQEAGAWERAWLRLRRSRQARATAITSLMVAGCILGAWWWHHHDAIRTAQTRVARIAEAVDVSQPDAVRLALAEIGPIRREFPDLPAATALAERLQAAQDLHAQQAQVAQQRAALSRLLQRARRTGPWSSEVEDWRQALATVGIALDQPTVPWRTHPLANEIAESLIWTWRAMVGHGDQQQALQAAALLTAGGPDPAWQALGRVCATSQFQAHDPMFPEDADGQAALANPDSAGVILAVFAPAPQLDARAWEVLRDRPGAFWPLIAAGRAALATGDLHAAQHLGLVASGAEPDSIYPPLLLAYTALGRNDDADLARAVGRGLRLNPAHAELLALQAVTLARAGHREDAQRVIDQLGGAHLQYHLQHRVGHPMERTVDALVQAGLSIPAAMPDLGPLVPAEHGHE